MNFESLQEVAQNFVKNGLFDRAEDIYSFVTTLYPANTSGWIGLGISRYFTGNITSALIAFDIACKIGPSSTTPLIWKIECFLKNGFIAEAKELLHELNRAENDLSDTDLLHIAQMNHIVHLQTEAIAQT